jgi:hypothetical protein
MTVKIASFCFDKSAFAVLWMTNEDQSSFLTNFAGRKFPENA